MKSSVSAVFAALTALCVIGCAVQDDGAINYRKTVSSAPSSTVESDTGTAQETLVLWKKYKQGEESSKRIAKGQSISIHLQQAFIEDFWEWFDQKPWNPSAEIAVVVNAFEIEGTKTFNFKPEGINNGRLVYYSDNVEKQQFLNFSFMPIYGPITYKGNPIALDIAIMELDAGSKAIKDMISLLANIGSTAYPPASPILTILDALGSSLVGSQDSTDDRIFQYRLVLYPYKDDMSPEYPILETGHYVFIRHEDRQDAEHWPGLLLDQHSGRLVRSTDSALLDKRYVKDIERLSLQHRKELLKLESEYSHQVSQRYLEAKAKKNQEFKALFDDLEKSYQEASDRLYRDNTYIVLQIQKGFVATSMDISQNIYGEVLPALQKAQEKDFSAVDTAIKTYRTESARINLQRPLMAKIARLKNTGDEMADTRRTLSRQILEELAVIITKEAQCADPQKSNNDECANNLQGSDIDQLLYELRLLMPTNSDARGHLSREGLEAEDGTAAKIQTQGENISAIVDAIVTGP